MCNALQQFLKTETATKRARKQSRLPAPNHDIHPILGRQAPPLSEEESTLPRNTRVGLERLRAERSLLLEKYKAKVENRPVESCIKGSDDVGDLKHFLKCYLAKPLPMSKLWKDPVALGLAVTPFDPGGDADP
uniref:Uncharacterized protein n=1 Tax=Caenorhabditis japonica TaxID=281687 RepID=A0A8R1EGI9_CAEJA